MRIDWTSLKSFITKTELYNNINYVQMQTSYYIWLFYEGESFSVILTSGSVECEDFVKNFKDKAVLKNNIAEDGVQITRNTFIGRSRTLRVIYTTFKTSSFEQDDLSGFFTMQLRDENGIITQDVSQAVYTNVDFCPGDNVAYSFFGGGLETVDEISDLYYVNAILAPDVSVNLGGAVYFLRNKQIITPKDKFFRNAINAGDIPGEKGYNVIRAQIKHPKGAQKKMQLEIQYYI
jgi:hypothetical protein